MITLFTTGCPKCRVLEKKLTDAGIDFNISDDIQEVIDQGFMTAPILKIDDTYLEFKEAVDWVNIHNTSTIFNDCDACRLD